MPTARWASIRAQAGPSSVVSGTARTSIPPSRISCTYRRRETVPWVKIPRMSVRINMSAVRLASARESPASTMAATQKSARGPGGVRST